MNRQRPDNSSDNPFQSPANVTEDYQVRGPGICPYCGETDFDNPSFTHWGGYVGPWLLTHAVCRRCRRGFNERTGASNLLNILLYQGGSVLLVILFLAICFYYIMPAWSIP